MKAQGAIVSALRKIRVARAGFDPSPEDVNDALEVLNSMLSSWANESLLVPYRTREAFTVTPSLNPHTFGTGGTFNAAQPISVEAITLNDGTADYALDVLFTAGEYQRIRVKDLPGRPERAWFEPGLTQGKLFFDYVPDLAYTATVLSLKPLTRFTSLTEDFNVPESYEIAITFSLAVHLAPDYGKEASGTVQRIAESALRALKSRTLALRVPIVEIDSALLRSKPFDINVIE
jgi:hypothetical protein